MAVLLHPVSGRRFTLAARTLVGRSVACTLSLKNPRVSGEHAALFYGGGVWSLRDLGSRNGTRLDGRALRIGERRAVEVGAELLFADERWVLDDDGPPVATGRSADGRRCRAEDGILALPGPDDPELLVYPAAEGRWVVERGHSLHFAADGDVFDLPDGRWTLELPLITDGGGTAHTLEDDELLRFDMIERLHVALSRDGETVEVTVFVGGRALVLAHRAHHCIIAALARVAVADIDARLPPAEQGWMCLDRLSRETGIGQERMYVEVYRARKQLGGAGVEGAGGLFERRSHARQIRLGVRAVTLGALRDTAEGDVAA